MRNVIHASPQRELAHQIGTAFQLAPAPLGGGSHGPAWQALGYFVPRRRLGDQLLLTTIARELWPPAAVKPLDLQPRARAIP